MTGREGVKNGKREGEGEEERKRKLHILLYTLYINLKNGFAPIC